MNNDVKQQAIVIGYNSSTHEIETKVNKYLDEGWKIVSVTPQCVANGSSGWSTVSGGYFIVVEKNL
jgi:hypothetical protein